MNLDAAAGLRMDEPRPLGRRRGLGARQDARYVARHAEGAGMGSTPCSDLTRDPRLLERLAKKATRYATKRWDAMRTLPSPSCALA